MTGATGPTAPRSSGDNTKDRGCEIREITYAVALFFKTEGEDREFDWEECTPNRNTAIQALEGAAKILPQRDDIDHGELLSTEYWEDGQVVDIWLNIKIRAKEVPEGEEEVNDLNINLYVSQPVTDAEAERLAAVLNEAIEYHGLARVVKPQVEPTPEVPEWRRMVDEARTHWPHPLASVLSSLANIDGYSDYDDRPDLARIVAVCEQEVGDGWQADPDAGQSTGSAWRLMSALADSSLRVPTESDWRCLGNAAAAWLAHLTGESA